MSIFLEDPTRPRAAKGKAKAKGSGGSDNKKRKYKMTNTELFIYTKNRYENYYPFLLNIKRIKISTNSASFICPPITSIYAEHTYGFAIEVKIPNKFVETTEICTLTIEYKNGMKDKTSLLLVKSLGGNNTP